MTSSPTGPPFESPMRDPVPMTDAEWEPFARATGIEPPFAALADYCTECGVCHEYHPHPNADPHEPWECRAAESRADRD